MNKYTYNRDYFQSETEAAPKHNRDLDELMQSKRLWGEGTTKQLDAAVNSCGMMLQIKEG